MVATAPGAQHYILNSSCPMPPKTPSTHEHSPGPSSAPVATGSKTPALFESLRLWVRGAGELGSAVALTLRRVGIGVFLTDLPRPLAIRRPVTFSDAILEGISAVEDIQGVRATAENAPQIISAGQIPVLEDSPLMARQLAPQITVDARMLKGSGGDSGLMSPFVIGLGPGFTAGGNCMAVVETRRGHNLGRVIWSGSAQPDTGIPGKLGGETARRVIYAPVEGALKWEVDFGALVESGQRLGTIDSHEIEAPITGLVRGLISPLVPMASGLKIADIDPRGTTVDYRTVSDKASAVSRAVLEAVLVHLRREPQPGG